MESIQEFLRAFERWSGESLPKVEYARNEYLSKQGQIEHFLYLIESGALRATYLSGEEEYTIRLAYQGSVISSLDSFISQRPSQFNLQAIRKTVAFKISREKYVGFVELSKQNMAIHLHLSNQLLLGMLDREIDLLTSSPKERYERILARSPRVFQEIPLKYIANYLRMTPETLSRLRSS